MHVQALEQQINVLSSRLLTECWYLKLPIRLSELIQHLSPVLNSLCRGCVLVNPGVWDADSLQTHVGKKAFLSFALFPVSPKSELFSHPANWCLRNLTCLGARSESEAQSYTGLSEHGFCRSRLCHPQRIVSDCWKSSAWKFGRANVKAPLRPFCEFGP